jgi:ankyrin repeat protein
LEDIGDQNWEYAHRLFQCVAAASRPLRVDELAEFLAFDFESESIPEYLEDWRPEDPGHAVLSTCSSLLTVVDVDDSPSIQFSHFSVKEYLVSTRIAEAKNTVSRFHVSMTSAHTIVAQACLGTLLHLDESITETGLKKYPLAEYAAKHWIGHSQFEEVSADLQDAMKRLFDPKNRYLSIWLWIYDPQTRSLRYIRPEYIPQDSTYPLHYAAFLGIHDVIKFLVVERSQDVNAQGFWDETPLGLACVRAHLKAARVLLQHDVRKETRCDQDRTPLDHASSMGAVDLVRLLLDHGADVKAQSKEYKNTPLHLASENGKTDVVRVLLEEGAEVNARNFENSTSLHKASAVGDVESSRVLLEYRADVGAQNLENRTPLHLASQGGYLDMVQLLLQYNADVHALDDQGQTPFYYASKREHQEVMQLLLKHGAEARDAITTDLDG